MQWRGGFTKLLRHHVLTSIAHVPSHAAHSSAPRLTRPIQPVVVNPQAGTAVVVVIRTGLRDVRAKWHFDAFLRAAGSWQSSGLRPMRRPNRKVAVVAKRSGALPRVNERRHQRRIVQPCLIYLALEANSSDLADLSPCR
jgi:hypothetical protein